MPETRIKHSFYMMKKWGIVLPILLFTPRFVHDPSATNLVVTTIFIVYYFFAFLGPAYLLRYMIKAFKLNQQAADMMAFATVAVEYGYVIWAFLDHFRFERVNFATALFLIPINMFLFTTLVLCIMCTVLYVTRIGVAKKGK